MADHYNALRHCRGPVREFIWMGYNDVTDGWIEESVDLSDYSGKKIWLRFEYVTDAAVNGEGFFLDDVSVDAIGYHLISKRMMVAGSPMDL